MYYRICVGIFILIFLILIIKKKGIPEMIATEFVSLLILCLLGLLIHFSDGGFTFWDQYSVKQDLYTLNDCIDNNNYKLSGMYLLIGGYVSAEKEPDKYEVTYAYKDDNDIIRPKHKEFDFNTDKFGYLEDGNNYYEEIHTALYYQDSDLDVWLFRGTTEPEKSIDKSQDIISDNIFHVPKGTVIKDINVKLK